MSKLPLLHGMIKPLLWFGDQKLVCTWFVYMHTTLSKWLSTSDLYATCRYKNGPRNEGWWHFDYLNPQIQLVFFFSWENCPAETPWVMDYLRRARSTPVCSASAPTAQHQVKRLAHQSHRLTAKCPRTTPPRPRGLRHHHRHQLNPKPATNDHPRRRPATMATPWSASVWGSWACPIIGSLPRCGTLTSPTGRRTASSTRTTSMSLAWTLRRPRRPLVTSRRHLPRRRLVVSERA